MDDTSKAILVIVSGKGMGIPIHSDELHDVLGKYYNIDWFNYNQQLKKLITEQYLTINNDRISLTQRGLDFVLREQEPELSRQQVQPLILEISEPAKNTVIIPTVEQIPTPKNVRWLSVCKKLINWCIKHIWILILGIGSSLIASYLAYKYHLFR